MTSVLAAGDVFCDLPDGAAAFAPLIPLFREADVVFANCEGVYTDRPAPAPSRKHFMGTSRERGGALAEVGIDVMALANNHMLDGGYDGLSDTTQLLAECGIAVTGAGQTLVQARTPAIIERDGTRIAFLAVCSTFPRGYEARTDRPGIAPLRVRTHYLEPDPSFWEPGIAPIVVTQADRADLEQLLDSITQATGQADIVVLACHWGSSGGPERLLAYELELARAAVDAGAHAVLCHHHHSLRGIELYAGSPIFYGLGALVHHFDPDGFSPAEQSARRARMGEAAFAAAQAFPLFPFDASARMTGLAVLDFEGGRVRAGFIPAEIQADGSTEPLREDDPRAERTFAHLAQLSEAAGLSTNLIRGNRDGWAYAEVTSR